MENVAAQKRCLMNWNADTEYDVIFTDTAREHARNILDYIYFELENIAAADSVRRDMQETAERLSHVAGALKMCDDPELRNLGYRTIRLKRHNYFMLYKVVGNQAYVVGIYHDLQDYENRFG